MTIGLCTDSNSQIPPDLAARFGVEVVPLTVVVDDHDYLDGVDIDADGFYAMFADGHRPAVETSQPSPGQFAAAYEDLVASGCTEILSVHACATASGTLNAARLAAHNATVPVRLVDSGTVSFGVSCCVWAAGEAIAAGASLDEAARVAESLAPSIGNVFVIGGLELLRASGWATGDLDGDVGAGTGRGTGIPVLTFRDGRVQVVERVGTADAAVQVMAEFLAGWGDGLKVALGIADRRAAPVTEALHAALSRADSVVEVIDYRLGPSIAEHTGPGTAGGFVFPSVTAGSR